MVPRSVDETAVLAAQDIGAPGGSDGPLTRLAARVEGSRLDRRLIAGEDVLASPLLRARAALLTTPRRRRTIASGLARLVQLAERCPRRWWDPHFLARREALSANAREIGALADLLQGPAPVYARGIAQLEVLLTDGTSAFYSGSAEQVSRALRDARAAAEGATPPGRTIST